MDSARSYREMYPTFETVQKKAGALLFQQRTCKVPSNIHLVLQTTGAFMMSVNKFATEEEKNKILRLDEAIREAENYIFIREQYESIWNKFIEDKGMFLRDIKS